MTIIIKKLTKEFKGVTVLDNISLNFDRGKIYGIIGRNGAGKTMLLKCICGFVIPSSGTIQINNRQISKDSDSQTNIGIIIEGPGFLANYSGFWNLKFLAMINASISDDQIKKTMALVGLDPKNKKIVGKYSLGMKQRLGIAQAIMENPEILILDEPMNGLDNQGVTDIRNLFLNLKNDGKTIILASHSKEDISILCDLVYEMDKGKIIKVSEK